MLRQIAQIVFDFAWISVNICSMEKPTTVIHHARMIRYLAYNSKFKFNTLMLMHLKSISVLLLLTVLTFAGMKASHYAGATITYECLSPNIYRVHHKVYRHCGGPPITPPSGMTITGIGTACSAPTGGGWVLRANREVTMLTPSIVTNCNGGSASGFLEWHYSQDFDFTGVTCNQYKLEWTECCRNGVYTNITNPSNTSAFVSTDTLNLALAPCNSSPEWRTTPPRYALHNRVNNFDLSATDVDGDSLVYTRVVPNNGLLGPISYNLGYSLGYPLGPSWLVILDPETGLLQVIPNPGNSQAAVLAIRVTEYRNGVAIGSVMREFEIVTVPTLPFANALPTISGPHHLQGAKYIDGQLVVHPGGNACLDFTATDTDLNNATQLGWMHNLPGGTLTDTLGGNPDSVLALPPWARVCWTASTTYGIDSLDITAIDTSCQLNNMVVNRFGFVIGDTSNVWPGDADNNLVADAFDLLPIGLAFGNTGAIRTGASNTWIGQASFPWQDTLLGGLDKKFVDCDGNATINADDTLAITLNYGLTHNKANLPVARGTATDPLLKLILPDSADVGDTISAAIVLGDANVGANNIYGYAFRLVYDQSLIDSSTFWIDFGNSWIGNSSNALDISVNHAPITTCDAAQVRTNHTSVSGMGEIARAHFVIIDNIDGKRQMLDSAMLNIFFTDVRIIGLNGEMIQVDVQQDSMLVYDRTTETPIPSEDAAIQISPNPAHDRLTIEVNELEINTVEFISVQGQLLLHQSGFGSNRLDIDMSEFARGLYFVRIETQNGWTTRRLVLE